jgi:hypothetical protein
VRRASDIGAPEARTATHARALTTILGQKASGLRDWMSCRVCATRPALHGVFRQFWQLQAMPSPLSQYVPLAKHSQYSFKHCGAST